MAESTPHPLSEASYVNAKIGWHHIDALAVLSGIAACPPKNESPNPNPPNSFPATDEDSNVLQKEWIELLENGKNDYAWPPHDEAHFKTMYWKFMEERFDVRFRDQPWPKELDLVARHFNRASNNQPRCVLRRIYRYRAF